MMKSGVRIIGGRWRGRKLAVPKREGLRPTPDRVRETLFNWLAADCRGAAVLDCFAGSGVLGFEALSRGAASLVAIEADAAVVGLLRQQREMLAAESVEIVHAEFARACGGLERAFDLVFIDPPYASPALRDEAISMLEQGGLLKPACRIYFEWPVGETFELPSARLQWLRRKRAGQINYAIAEWR